MSSIIELCRELRRRETDAEKALWIALRNRNLSKHKFLRQYPICVTSTFGKNIYYIPDFYCHKAKLVIEADGPIHLLKKDYDKNRDEVLKALGLTIVRFKNDDIINDIEQVINTTKISTISIIVNQQQPSLRQRRREGRRAKRCRGELNNPTCRQRVW